MPGGLSKPNRAVRKALASGGPSSCPSWRPPSSCRPWPPSWRPSSCPPSWRPSSAAPPVFLAGLLLALLPADGALGARDVAVAVDEVDVVRVHFEATVGDLLRAALGDAGLLSLHLPDCAVLHVVHEVLLALDTQLCDFLRHLGSPPSESLRKNQLQKAMCIVSGGARLSSGIPVENRPFLSLRRLCFGLFSALFQATRRVVGVTSALLVACQIDVLLAAARRRDRAAARRSRPSWR